MKKYLEEQREIQSCRIGRTAQTRLVRSSQIPKDFFSCQGPGFHCPTSCSLNKNSQIHTFNRPNNSVINDNQILSNQPLPLPVQISQSHTESCKLLTKVKPRCSEDYNENYSNHNNCENNSHEQDYNHRKWKDNDKLIFQQFKSMFKIRKNLQSLALKFNTKSKEIQQSVFWYPEKQKEKQKDKQNNGIVRLPSLHLSCKIAEQTQNSKKNQLSINNKAFLYQIENLHRQNDSSSNQYLNCNLLLNLNDNLKRGQNMEQTKEKRGKIASKSSKKRANNTRMQKQAQKQNIVKAKQRGRTKQTGGERQQVRQKSRLRKKPLTTEVKYINDNCNGSCEQENY